MMRRYTDGQAYCGNEINLFISIPLITKKCRHWLALFSLLLFVKALHGQCPANAVFHEKINAIYVSAE
ncbi:MAG: hypothetical protein ABIU77_13705, partial [Ferruginibacter sp.]